MTHPFSAHPKPGRARILLAEGTRESLDSKSDGKYWSPVPWGVPHSADVVLVISGVLGAMCVLRMYIYTLYIIFTYIHIYIYNSYIYSVYAFVHVFIIYHL